MVRIILSCMDRRLNSILDKEDDGNTVFVRNAGGNMKGVEQTIRYIIDNSDVREMLVVEHGDCGGMKYVQSVVKEKADPTVDQALSDAFIGAKFADLAGLEKANVTLQKSAAEKFVSGKPITVSTRFVDASEFKTEGEREHVLIVTSPPRAKTEAILKSAKSTDASLKSAQLSDCYFVQADPSEINGPVAIAIKKLHIKEIRVVAVAQDEKRAMKSAADRINIRYGADGAHAAYIDCTDVR